MESNVRSVERTQGKERGKGERKRSREEYRK